MKTKKQEELANAFLTEIEEDARPLYREIILYLSQLGYNPKKEKSSISFKHDLHNKQLAKMGFKSGKTKTPFFALRYSACRGYSQRFADIVGAAIVKYPTRAARCTEGVCNFCAGAPQSHVYTYTFPDGETKEHCGAYALDIPHIRPEDIGEIKTLIREEHEYLMEHQVGRD